MHVMFMHKCIEKTSFDCKNRAKGWGGSVGWVCYAYA